MALMLAACRQLLQRFDHLAGNPPLRLKTSESGLHLVIPEAKPCHFLLEYFCPWSCVAMRGAHAYLSSLVRGRHHVNDDCE
jgi:hypothetical protein